MGKTENEYSYVSELKRKEVTASQRKQHNEKLHNLYSTSNIMRKIKSRRMSWAGHVTLIGEIKNAKDQWKGTLGRPWHL
jgi:hypothetical protein